MRLNVPLGLYCIKLNIKYCEIYADEFKVYIFLHNKRKVYCLFAMYKSMHILYPLNCG